MSRRLQYFLTISVLLNVLLLSTLMSHLWHHHLTREQHAIEALAAQLPEDKRAHFSESLQKLQDDAAVGFAQLWQAREASRALLASEPFDKAAYLKQAQLTQTMSAEIMRQRAEAIATLAEHSSPQERALLADYASHPPRLPHPARE